MPAVRNLRSLGGVKPIPVIHFIPSSSSLIYKLELVSSTETIDVTKSIVEGSFIDGVTSTVGSFNFKLLDPTNNYSSRIEEFDTVKLYLDYGTTATTLRFAGKIEKKSNSEYLYLLLSGKSMAIITTGIKVTYSSGGLQARSVILKAILDKYFSGTISTSGVEDDLGEINVDYSEVPFWEVVENLCNSGGRDAYVSPASVMNYFVKGSRKNITDAIIEQRNLVNPDEFVKDSEEIITKVRVYGKEEDSIPIIATSSSDTSVTKGIVKVRNIENVGIITIEQAQALADSEYELNKVLPTIGSIRSFMLPTIAPGEQLRIVSPTNNIPPLFYDIYSYVHTFTRTGVPMTTVRIKKPKLDIPQALKKNVLFQTGSTVRNNPNEADYSYIEKFDSSKGTLTNTLFRQGKLITDGSSSGTWSSGTVSLKVIPEEISFTLANLSDPVNITLRVSFDGGLVFKTVISNGVGQDVDFDNFSNKLLVEINLNSSTATVGTMGVLYK